MNCSHIKALILTDYLDGEAAEAVRDQIKIHLASCADCAAFERQVREKISLPLRALPQLQPPEETWQRIRDSIEAQQENVPVPEELYAPSFPDRLRDLWAGVFAVRKPAFAFAAVLSLIVVAVAVFQPIRRQQVLVKDYLNEQRMFLASADRPYNGVLDEDFSLGTTIEKYFF